MGCAAGDAEPWGGKPLIKQDLWHALHREIALTHVVHGGFGPLCLQLSKAFALLNPELLEALMRAVRLRHPNWSEREVAQPLYGRYAAARQRHVPAVIPPPGELLVRFRRAVRAFTGVKDAKTGGVEKNMPPVSTAKPIRLLFR